MDSMWLKSELYPYYSADHNLNKTWRSNRFGTVFFLHVMHVVLVPWYAKSYLASVAALNLKFTRQVALTFPKCKIIKNNNLVKPTILV